MGSELRTAICMSGLPRQIKETWKSYVEFLHNSFPNPDLFIYTGEEFDTPDFFDTIKPKGYVVEPQYSTILWS